MRLPKDIIVHYEERADGTGIEGHYAGELIRCFECKHSSPNGKYGCKLYHFRLYETHEMNADDYCSRAEREKNE